MSNRAFLLTPPGAAGIAVVRITGPAVGEFLSAHFSRRTSIGRAVHGELREADRVIDDAMVVLAREDIADLNLHGGQWVVRSALDLARRSGFEVVENAGAISEQAVDGRSELETEILTHLPLARTELGVRVLLAQAKAWQELQSSGSRAEIESVLADRTLHHLLHPPTVAIIGAANVGKSTLANQLFAQERSITADVPGTTRDWVGEIANINGLPVVLMDTPGIRATDDPIESTAIERSRREVSRAELIVLVLDASRLLEEQSDLLTAYPDALRVVNKADRERGWSAAIEGIQTIATTGQGIESLREQIVRSLCGEHPIKIDRARCWTDRQRVQLRDALK